jgi:hypothetical protein
MIREAEKGYTQLGVPSHVDWRKWSGKKYGKSTE